MEALREHQVRKTFEMRSRTPLAALLAANVISITGNRITQLAIPWFVLQTTGSVAKTGLVGFFSLLPFVLSSALGGVIVDRLGYRRASIVADLAIDPAQSAEPSRAKYRRALPAAKTNTGGSTACSRRPKVRTAAIAWPPAVTRA